MRVAVDLTPLLGPRTGIGLVVDEVATRLAERQTLELTGLQISWRGRSAMVEALPFGWSRRNLKLPARACRALWLRSDRPALKGFDVVHGLNYVVPPAGGGAELVAVHDLTAWRYPELVDRWSVQYPRLLRRALARGAHVHTGSSFVARELIETLGIDPDRVHTLRYAHGSNRKGNPQRGRREVGGFDYLIAIGTIEPRKDYVGLIEAMTGVWEQHPGLRLVIVGQSGWGADAVDEAIGASPRPDQILRLGYVDEQTKVDLLAGALALVYPSLYEGFGFPLLEAMAQRVPVVATTAGSIPEVAGQAALLVPPSDPEALAQAMIDIVGDSELAAACVTAGREQLTGFSWDQMVDDLVGVYPQLV